MFPLLSPTTSLWSLVGTFRCSWATHFPGIPQIHTILMLVTVIWGSFCPKGLFLAEQFKMFIYTLPYFWKGQSKQANRTTSFGNVQLLRIYLLRHYFTHVPKSNLSKKSNVRECSVIRNNSSLIHAYTCWYIEIKKLTQILCEIIRIFILKKWVAQLLSQYATRDYKGDWKTFDYWVLVGKIWEMVWWSTAKYHHHYHERLMSS